MNKSTNNRWSKVYHCIFRCVLSNNPGLTLQRWDTEAQQRCVQDGWLGWDASGQTSLSSHPASEPHQDTPSWTYLMHRFTSHEHITSSAPLNPTRGMSYRCVNLKGLFEAKYINSEGVEKVIQSMYLHQFCLWFGKPWPAEEQLCRETQCLFPHPLEGNRQKKGCHRCTNFLPHSLRSGKNNVRWERCKNDKALQACLCYRLSFKRIILFMSNVHLHRVT